MVPNTMTVIHTTHRGLLAPDLGRTGAEAENDDQVDDQHDQQHGGDEAAHQPGGVFALRFLTFEKLRGHISNPLNGRPQINAKSIGRPCTGARPDRKNNHRMRPV